MRPNSKYPASTVATPKAVTFGSASIAALLAGGASTVSGQVTLGGSAFTVDNQTVLWDLDNDGHDDFRLIDKASTSGGSGPVIFRQRFDGQSSTSTEEKAGWMATDGSSRISPFNTSVSVSVSKAFADQAFITDNGALQVQAVGFTDGGTHYIGFRFFRGSDTHYGWANITTTWGAGNSLVVNEWAWNATPFTAIQIGAGGSAVPEPATAATGLGLLALGAAGLRRQRWLKRKAA